MGETQGEATRKKFPGYDFDTFDGCVTAFGDEPSIDDPEAFCAWLDEEGAEALSDPNAEEVLAGLEVEFVSAVDRPAQSSEWLIAKNQDDPEGDRHRWQSEVTLYVRKDDGVDDDGEREAKQIAFAPVLVPKEADKDGDVIPKPAIEDAAHKYLAEYRKVDSDHDLRDGKGTPVESWTLKADTTFELPDGTESRTYPKGTWVMGIKFDDETWGRVLDGDLTGLSIYGGAKPIDVESLLQGAKGTGTQTKDADGNPEDDVEPQGSTSEDGAEAPVGKHESMGTEDDPGDNAGNDDDESVIKQLDAGQVSEMLATVGEKSGVSGDSTIKEFVMALVEDGDVDEAEVRNMAVLLNGGSDGDGGEAEGDGDDGGEGEGEDDAGIDLDADGKSEGEDDGDDVDKDADDGGEDDVEKSVGDDRIDRIESAVESLAGTVEDLQKKVDDEPWADKMSVDDDLSDRIAKDLTGADDADVARNALREQVAKNDDDDGGPNVDYEGITEGEDATAEASSTPDDDGGSDTSNHSKAANTRMTGAN